MNRLILLVLSIVIILVFGLVGCGTNNNGEYNTIEEPKVFEESNQVDDFEVTLKVEKEELAVIAMITYLGEKDKIDIYHGGSIFFFNIYQKDGNFEYMGEMNQPLLTTTLTRNEPHKVEFTDTVLDELGPGTYEFEAIANVSLDKENIVDSHMNIPVSLIVKIE